MTSFSVVSYMRESHEIVDRFVRYYLHLGADEVFIFVDGPAGDLAKLATDQVRIISCDDTFWAKENGHKPDTLEDAQSAVFMMGYRAAQTDWVMVVDADEFAFGPLKMNQVLADIPADIDAVVLPTAEAVWMPDDPADLAPFSSTGFRVATKGRGSVLARLIYGPKTAALFRHGLIGHMEGKQILRTGRKFDRIVCHRATRDGVELGTFVGNINPAFSEMYVAHFDAIGFDRWSQKWTRRLEGSTNAVEMGRRRLRQLQAIKSAQETGPAELQAMCRRLYGLTPAQWTALKTLNLAFRHDIFADVPGLPRAEPA